jgi:hypothetical protein
VRPTRARPVWPRPGAPAPRRSRAALGAGASRLSSVRSVGAQPDAAPRRC